MLATVDPETSELRLAPRIAPQPSSLSLGPGESKVWQIIGMDLEGLSADKLVIRFNPQGLNVSEVSLGAALQFDPSVPPSVSVDHDAGTITVRPTNGKPLAFTGGGQVLTVRVHGGMTGDTFLVMDNPAFHTASGQSVTASVASGRARVQ
jgi:hypothetical protein